MSKMGKKVLPTLLAASMVCGSVSPAYAADLFSAGEAVEFVSENANVDMLDVHVYYRYEGLDLGEEDITVEENDARQIHATSLTKIPAGYMLAENANLKYIKDVNGATDYAVFARIEVVPAPATKEITVKFQNYDGEVLTTSKMTVDSNAGKVNTNTVVLPEKLKGYVIAVEGELFIENDELVVTVRKDVQTITVEYRTAEGELVDTATMEVAADEVHVNYNDAELTDKLVAEGYKFPLGGDESIIDGKVVLIVEKEIKTVKVYVAYMYGDILVDEEDITVEENDEHKIPVEKLNIPEEFMLAEDANLKYIFDQVSGLGIFAKIKIVPATKVIDVEYQTAEGELVGTSTMEVAADETHVDYKDAKLTDELVAEGYKFPREGSEVITPDGKVVLIVEKEIKTVKVHVYYMDKIADAIADEDDIDVEENDEHKIPVEKLNIPDGYMLAEDANLKYIFDQDGDLGTYASIKVVPAKKVITVEYQTADGKVVDTATMEVAADETHVNYNDVKLTEKLQAEGYVLALEGSELIVNDKVAVIVKKNTKEVEVIFRDRNNHVIKGGYTTTVAADARVVNTTTIKNVPKGYEIAIKGDLEITNGKVYVTLDKVKAKTKKVQVIFRDRNNHVIKGGYTMTVAADARVVNTTTIKNVPKGYEIAIKGDLEITNGKVYVTLDKVKAKTKKVTVVYRTSDKKKVGSEVVKVSADANKVKLSDLTAPTGYTIISTKDATIKGSTAYVTVKRTTKKVNVIFKTIDGELVETRPMEVNATTKYLNANDLKAKDGYTIISKGKVYFDENGNALVLVKRTSRNVKVYFKTINGTVVGSTDMGKMSMDIEKINVSKLKAPAGYTIISKGSVKIDSNGNAYVRVARSW